MVYKHLIISKFYFRKYTQVLKKVRIISKIGEDSPAQHIADDFFGWIGYTMRIILCFFEMHWRSPIVRPKKLFGRA